MSGSVGTKDTNVGGNVNAGFPTQQPTSGEEATESPASGNKYAPQPNVAGLGALAAMPTPSTNGTPLAAAPQGATSVRFYLPPGASLTYSVQPVQPVAAPPTVTLAGPAAATGAPTLMVDELLASGEQVFVTAITGAVVYRYR